MCGVAGIINKKGVDSRLLGEMRDSLIHRGPDDSGIWISDDRKIGLAHQRLSIIDLSELGRQPMSDENNKIWITYNGEIYNFEELREILEKKGYRFCSRTDTEVIIYAYREWGIECVNRLNGMFAFALYDMEKEKLFLVRDRIGKKPLYYAQYNNNFVFSSEIKAFVKDKNFPKDIDFNALNFYFAFGYIPGDLCIFNYVKKLPPAHILTLDLKSGDLKYCKYWEIPSSERKKNLKEEELLEQLEALLRQAVAIRLKSDVPLGAFLSGGIDSSLIVALMSQISSKPVKTFTIGFLEKKYNELPYAKIVSQHFQTEHHELIIRPDVFQTLSFLMQQIDEPFSDSSIIPTYYVSRETRRYVKVAISGDGGDELFGGYIHYPRIVREYQLMKFIPSFIRKGLAGIGKKLPERQKLGFLKRMGNDNIIQNITDIGIFNFKFHEREQLFKKEVTEKLTGKILDPELYRMSFANSYNGDYKTKAYYADFKTSLIDDMLVKVDRASMLVSLEVRSPLLDYRIVEFAFKNIPSDMKTRGIVRIRNKYLLKKLAKRILPKELNLERKQGFSIPIGEWLRNDLNQYLKERLLESEDPFLSRDYLKNLIDIHQRGFSNLGKKLFTVLMFKLWWEQYGK